MFEWPCRLRGSQSDSEPGQDAPAYNNCEAHKEEEDLCQQYMCLIIP